MTAEEAKAKAEIVWNARWKGADERHIIDRIAAAIRAAEADMRERCAKAAETWRDVGVPDGETGCQTAWLESQDCGASEAIAAAIRALE